ncbi:MAG: hypothetical protein ACKN83_04795 [Vulcanococcus sp.]
MSLLQRLLLLPLLSPLLAVLLVGALNPRPWVALRLLTWTSPAWPLGAWIGGAAAAGAALSATAAGLALQTGTAVLGERRQVRRRPADDDGSEAWSGTDPGPRSPRWGAAPSSASDTPGSTTNPWSHWAGPTRAAAEPPPTVSVPFRVIRKGRGTASTATVADSPATTPQAGAIGMAVASAVGDGWDTPTGDDW